MPYDHNSFLKTFRTNDISARFSCSFQLGSRLCNRWCKLSNFLCGLLWWLGCCNLVDIIFVHGYEARVDPVGSDSVLFPVFIDFKSFLL